MRVHSSILHTVAVLCLIGYAAPLRAQSLADIARREEERRKTIASPAKVLTNKDLKPAPAIASGTQTSTPAAPSNAVTPPAGGGAAQGGSAAGGDVVKDQAYWSGRWKNLQGQISRDETFAIALQSRINALANQYTNQGDGVQQTAIAAERQKTLEELNRLTKQVQDEKRAILDLQEEARRAGVPPGWLR
jgi:hypothetical protein